MLHRLKTQYVSVALLAGSAVCLMVTALLVMNSGGLVYFLTFHAPLHLPLAAASPSYKQSVLPTFDVHTEVSQSKLSADDTLAIHIAVASRQTIPAYLEIWVRGPNNREMYKYPADVDTAQPVQFAAGKSQVFDEAYTLPANAPQGQYKVSASIISTNQQVDYYNAHNFASFEVL